VLGIHGYKLCISLTSYEETVLSVKFNLSVILNNLLINCCVVASYSERELSIFFTETHNNFILFRQMNSRMLP
jgi:hypothetical protein